MRKKLAKRKKEPEAPVKNASGILIANIAALITAILLSLLCSALLLKSPTLSSNLSIYLVACIGIGALLNGFIAAKKCSLKGIVSGLASSVPYTFSVTVIMLFFTKGQLVSKTLIVDLTAVICSVLGGIFGANTRRIR